MERPQRHCGEQTDFGTLGLFAVASLATIALGSAGLALAGAAPGTWMRNPAAWLVGLALAGAIVAAGRSALLSKAVILLAVAGLVATLFSPAQSGVHRWVDAGPLHINMAALLLPAALVGLATAGLAAPLLLAALAAIGLLLVAQPDASQATAFALAAGVLLLRRSRSRAARIAGTAGLAGLALMAWSRPDPLVPVREVEGIFALLGDISPLLAAVGGLGLAITSALPLRRSSPPDGDTAEAAKALALYCAVAALMPAVGAFPVPLVGMGMSFPVGYWLGLALLCARRPARGQAMPGRPRTLRTIRA